MKEAETEFRLDKWLWAARFFKTRGAASQAVDGGKVDVNGDRPKRARRLQPGDEVRVRLGPYEHVVIVRALSSRRGPASVAAALYEETAASKEARELLALRMKATQPAFHYDKGKPSKKERRMLLRLKDGDE